jgi:hypothetical protein
VRGAVGRDRLPGAARIWFRLIRPSQLRSVNRDMHGPKSLKARNGFRESTCPIEGPYLSLRASSTEFRGVARGDVSRPTACRQDMTQRRIFGSALPCPHVFRSYPCPSPRSIHTASGLGWTRRLPSRTIFNCWGWIPRKGIPRRSWRRRIGRNRGSAVSARGLTPPRGPAFWTRSNPRRRALATPRSGLSTRRDAGGSELPPLPNKFRPSLQQQPLLGNTR